MIDFNGNQVSFSFIYDNRLENESSNALGRKGQELDKNVYKLRVQHNSSIIILIGWQIFFCKRPAYH